MKKIIIPSKMSAQTQPLQKQTESIRRGMTPGTINIIPRANIQTNAALVSFDKNTNEGNDFEFFEVNYETKKEEKGWVYTWGSGEMGQLGYNIKVITKMPKDREGYPYQPQPFMIESLKDRIFQISGGDGHTVAIDIRGKVYSWGASAWGQLGLSSMKDLPTDIEGYPYQPTPRVVELLSEAKIVQISCGDAHTVALSSDGKLYSWGGGGCGQLGHPDTQLMPKDEDGCPYQPKPKLISALKNMQVKQIAWGKAHTVAVLENGHLYSWGAGAWGQLGHPDTSSFPSDEDGYPFQPIPRCVWALKNLFLVHASCGDVHTMVLTIKGEIYCFGGGSWGQLGLGNISQLPLDVDSCPFMPVPQKIETLSKEFIVKLSCGDSHSMALTKEGAVYAWGEATCGQLGFEDLKNLPRNADGRVYQPIPQKVIALDKKKIVEISCGEAHSLVLTDKGHVFGIGANSWGQLGQFYTEMKASEAEEIFQARTTDTASQSFNTYLETSSVHSAAESDDSNRSNKSSQENLSDDEAIKLLENSVNSSLPQMNIFEEQKQKESVSLSPKLIKSLMHRKVLKISSGGVHNICIVEAFPNHLAPDLYRCFMKSKWTDICFVFKERAFSAKDLEEEKEEEEEEKIDTVSRPKNKLRKGFYEHRVYAHKFVLAARSDVFQEMFRKLAKSDKKEWGVININIKDCSFKAFRIILDYIYLDNLNILDDISGCSELTEILKLSKHYHLPELSEKCERQFLALSSIQLFKNLITNSFSTNSFLKRSKEKKRGEQGYGQVESSRTPVSEVFEHNIMANEISDSELQFKRSTFNKKQNKGKNENLDGVMFLADGRVVIVNNDLFQEVMKKGIIVDLKDRNSGSPAEEESKEYVNLISKPEVHRSISQNKTKQAKPISSANAQSSRRSTSAEDSTYEKSDSMKNAHVPLKKEILKMLNDQEFSDIILSVSDKEIYAHRSVLWSRSTYFKAMFSHDFKEADKTKIVLKGISSYDLFYNLLEFMYSDCVKINIKNSFDMLSLADEYGVVSYKEKCEILLSKYITVTTVWVIFKYANEYNCERLKETCLVYMEENYDEVIYSSGFEELDKDEMLKIIRLCKDKKSVFGVK
jgi:alpha-tubulin suppressor-like RCC1 family protein